ncbi:MAG: hypothetical protein LBL26_02495, partial [Peptococcaceae bacterium]|nr:hypothetical protein [Peptococcaceae bacterium]
TDSAGKILVGNLPEGAYVVSEIQAPAGYMLDNAPQTIVIEGGKLHNMEFLDKPLSGIEIQKLNAVTQAPLSGATFVVERDTGEKIGTYQTDAAGKIIVPDLEAGTYIVSETVAPAGYILDARPQTAIVKSGRLTVVEFLNHPLSGIEIIKTDAYTHAPLSGAEFIVERPNGERVGKYLTDIAGKILVPDLAEGVYIVSETQSPAEYVLDAQPQTVEVKSGRLAVAEFTNKPFPFLYIKKVDASTGQLVAGAQFTVTNANGLIIANVTSLASGAVAVKVAPGVYTVTEIKAPDGYELNNPTQTVEVFADGHTADHASGAATAGNSADFANKPLNTLEIVKLDAATKNPLPGAMFTVDRANGERVGAYRTDASGKILIPDITEGTYVISETAAPDGYILSESPKSVNIQGGKLVSVEFLNKPLSGIEIVKLDAVTHAPLTGAAFTVTKADGERIGTFRTEADGKILVPDLDEGVYVVGEIQAPDGYLIDETPKNVTVKSGRLAVVEFVNSPLSGVQILKVDSVTKIPLKDARFTVYRQSGAIVGTYATDAAGMIIIDRLEPGWYKAAETKAPDGYIPDGTARDFEIASGQFIKLIFENKPLASLQIRKIDAISGEPLSGAVFEIREQGGAYIAEVTTDASGSASVAELEPNWYVIAEIKAPQGYILDGAAKTVEVKAVTPTVVTVANQPLSGIEIIKLDAATHVPLPDATFTVERPDGERIGTYQTDAAGKILVPDLTEGTYIISETLAPNGYILDAAPRTVIVQSGKLAVAEFVNNPLAGLKIIKLDSATRSPIEGVEFAVSKMDGERVEDEFRASAFKTDSTGQIFIPRLANGYYNVTETKAADGYLPDSEPKTVLVESGKTTLLEVLNTPMNGLLIVKTDESTGSSLAGVVFDVRRADGQFVTGSILDGNQPDTEANSPNRAASPNGDITGSYTTDAQGRILINGLPAGVYHITERQTLAGYELDTNVHSITVTPGKLAALQLTNRQKAGFRLLKIDSVTRRGIYGVEFMVFDGNNKVVGNYTTDDKGVIDFDGILTEGRYTIRETRPAEGYYADDMPRTVEFKSGRTTEIVWENTPEAGQIQITKKSADDNAVNGFPAGTLLQGAVFEIYDRANNLVDTVKSDKSGLAVSKALPIGRYTIRESQAPAYYSAIRDAIETEIEFSGQIVRLAVLNSSAYTHVSVVKRGYTEVVPGQSIRYDFKDIGNNSTASLDSFYWRDTLPTDAVRLDKIITGTWSARLSYKIVYKTNVSSGDYRTLSDNLITDKIRTIDASPAALGLASNEYVTEFMFVFGRVPAGFKQIDAPYIYCNVLPNLAHEYRFANKTDVGGLWGANQWVMANDRWVTVVYSKATPQVLPRTGY